MKHANKPLAFLLTLVLASGLSGCGGKPAPSPTSQAGGPSQAAPQGTEPSLTLEVYIGEDVVWDENAVALRVIQEEHGVKLNPIRRPGMNQEQWYTLQFSSGASFDYIESGGLAFKNLLNFIEQDLICELDRSMIQQNMPNYMDWVARYSPYYKKRPF